MFRVLSKQIFALLYKRCIEVNKTCLHRQMTLEVGYFNKVWSSTTYTINTLYGVKETSYRNNKDHQLRDIFLMYYQVLRTGIKRNLGIVKEN